MIVIAHPKAAPDQFTDHRTDPYARLIPGGHRPRLDPRDQLLVLLVGQPRLATGAFSRSQTIGSIGLEPLQPTIDGAASHLEPHRLLNNADAIEIAQDRCCPSPGLQTPRRFASCCNLRNSRSSRRVVRSALMALPFCARPMVLTP